MFFQDQIKLNQYMIFPQQQLKLRKLFHQNVNVVIEFPNDQITGLLIKKSNQLNHLLFFSINLWNIIKNCVGKDLSKIPIPVNFSEPISMLQRITEELEYSSVLDMAAKTNDNWEQLAYVAAFTVSSYSTTATRVNKPFNPLLGETFECDRTDDLGWRSMAGKELCHFFCPGKRNCCFRASESSSTSFSNTCRRTRLDFISRIHNGIKISGAIFKYHTIR
jgi:hypothetical protein